MDIVKNSNLIKESSTGGENSPTETNYSYYDIAKIKSEIASLSDKKLKYKKLKNDINNISQDLLSLSSRISSSSKYLDDSIKIKNEDLKKPNMTNTIKLASEYSVSLSNYISAIDAKLEVIDKELKTKEALLRTIM